MVDETLVYDSNVTIQLITPSSSSPPTRYRLFPTCELLPMAASDQSAAAMHQTRTRARMTRPSPDPTGDLRTSIDATLRQTRAAPREVHPALRHPNSPAKVKPALTIRTAEAPLTPPRPSPPTTGLRTSARSRYMMTPKTPSPTSPTSPDTPISFPTPPSGLRRPGDTTKAPASAHMRSKARRLEVDVLSKPAKPPKRTTRGLGPTAFSTLGPATLSTMTTPVTANTYSKSEKDSAAQKRVKRKPLPEKKPSWQQLRPRPSSPTLVETFRRFDDTPRSPPPTPVGASMDRVVRDEVKSAWDSDDSGAESEGEVMGEKAGLVGRVRRLTVGNGTGTGQLGRTKQKELRQGRVRKRGGWLERLLCNAD